MTSEEPKARERMQDIRAAFRRQLLDRMVAIQEAHARCEAADASPADREALFRMLHNLRGASASFGFRDLGEAALGGEQLAREACQEGRVDPGWHGQLRECIARMTLAAARVEGPMPEAFVPKPLPRTGPAAAGRKSIFLCDDDPFQCQAMAEQIRCFGFRVSPFKALEPFQEAVAQNPPDAIVMDMMFPGRPLGGAEAVTFIQAGRADLIPTVFISSQGSLPFRLAATRAGSSAYLVKPVNITDLCARLASLTTSETPEPYRVLIVDDDPPLAEYHARILRQAGMETRIVNDPLLALEPLLEMRPDLILMDLYMPGCDGAELARTIRQIDACFSIPIVFLSSEGDVDRQIHAMATGGDEFLTKPIKPENLVAAVAVRAERMKILRSLMIRDSLTGLFNHTATQDFLDSAVADAARTGKDACFAMIDVDNFKQVNDAFGHALGDRVLITLSRLLRQRVRKSDIVGRFGGEEFAVILPDCGLPEAKGILDDLRLSFAGITYQAGDRSFSSTFSAGVAALSMQDGAAALYQAADSALYLAKSAGRNQVFPPGPGQVPAPAFN